MNTTSFKGEITRNNHGHIQLISSSFKAGAAPTLSLPLAYTLNHTRLKKSPCKIIRRHTVIAFFHYTMTCDSVFLHPHQNLSTHTTHTVLLWYRIHGHLLFIDCLLYCFTFSLMVAQNTKIIFKKINFYPMTAMAGRYYLGSAVCELLSYSAITRAKTYLAAWDRLCQG